jgi:hypothetical protein
MNNINMEVYINIIINDDILHKTNKIEIKEKNTVKGQQDNEREVRVRRRYYFFPQFLIPRPN